ncbi:unnamed protein product [Rotaria sp. Silwood1]|nr:unnamed protein product [Rotaria sp. Silwood1]
MGHYPKALEFHEKPLKITEKAVPRNHSNLTLSYKNIGQVSSKMGHLTKALEFHEKTFNIREEVLPPNHSDSALSKHEIGLVYEKLGQYSKASQFYERAVEIAQHPLPWDHPHLHSYEQRLQNENEGQLNTPANHDINVIPAWLAGYSGKGVTISIIDDGLDHKHPELNDRYKPQLSYDLNDLNDIEHDPSPRTYDSSNNHGTRCAGASSGKANNGMCGVGVAYNSYIADGTCMIIDMPVRKQDAYRALELLEEYYNRLDSPEDKPLKNAIDRVIKVFKSRLFQALLDIQEFYESILLDEQRDPIAKTDATLHLAEEWEKQPMLKRNIRNGTPTIESPMIAPMATNNTLSRPTNIKENSKRQTTPTPFSQMTDVTDGIQTNRLITTGLNSPTDITQFNYDDHWQEIEIDLERPPNVGLGFSIAGGTDTPCISDSPAVVVTRITEGGLADRDQRLKLHDIILRVNSMDFTRIEHQAAVDGLKAAGNHVNLLIRRLAPPIMEEIQLNKPPNANLGFSIAGGISHEHVKGDYGIFITNIIPGGIADKNGRLKVGDRLMHVQSLKNAYDLQFVEHKHAVESIRRACDESQTITLLVGHPTDYPGLADTTIQHINGHRSPIQNEEHGDFPLERRVLLRRGQNGFGFNIVGGDGEEGIYISFIQAGGIADKSGELHKGDRILSVNNTDFRGVTHEEAATVLKNCGDTADLHVIYKYDDFIRFENRIDERRSKMTGEIAGSTGSLKTSTKRQFFVRAEFDYDPSKDPSIPGDRGLSFRAGDILYVTNAADDSWWQAKRITDGQEEEELGIIPSKSRVEKKERARQKRVNFNQGSNSRSNTLDRDKKKKKKFGLFGKSGDRKDTQSGDDSDNEQDNLEPVPSYELVTQHEVNHTRPVIIFGPFKELLNDQLLNDHPDKFANCVPHTSRPKREKEVDGREYYFVPSREQMERDIQNYLFIEAGEYGGNLYGTSVSAVREVANASKHCILDVSGHAIRRLITAGLFPVAIYVKPRDVKWILDNMGEEANEERAQQMYEKSIKIEQQFGDLLTTVVEEETLNDVYDHICAVIDREQSLEYVWIPSKEKL